MHSRSKFGLRRQYFNVLFTPYDYSNIEIPKECECIVKCFPVKFAIFTSHLPHGYFRILKAREGEGRLKAEML